MTVMGVSNPTFVLATFMCYGTIHRGVDYHKDAVLSTDLLILLHTGGLFTYVSGANYLGEIIEWIGYALATWSPPGLAFAFFSLCYLGQRASHHHR